MAIEIGQIAVTRGLGGALWGWRFAVPVSSARVALACFSALASAVASPVVVLVLVASAGCASTSTKLAPPLASAPQAERAAWWAAHAPLDHVDGALLVLKDGTQIDDVRDLRAAVDDASPTARAIDRAADLTWRRDVALAAASGLLGVGAASPVVSASVEPDLVLPVALGGMALLAAGLGVFFVAEDLAADVWREQAAAMITFGADAEQRLGLAPTQAAATSTPPAPLSSTPSAE